MILKKSAKIFVTFGILLMLLTLIVSCTTPFETLAPDTTDTTPDSSTQERTETPSSESTPDTTDTPESTTDEPVVTTQAKPVFGNPSAIGATSSQEDSLPTLSINTENGEEIVSRDEYLNATISAEGTNDDEVFGFKDRTLEVRCRGNFTYTGTDKKSYRLKFTEKINLFGQGNGPAKSWVLLANHCDQSFLRNHIAFILGNKLSGISYCSSSSFVKLFINGEYRGIYQVAEQHQVNTYRVNITEDPDVVNTDYLIERDSYASDGCVEGLDYFKVNKVEYRVHSDFMTEEKCYYLMEYIQKTHDAVKDGSQANVMRYIDLKSLIDTFILQAMMKNIDVGYSSFFMVKKGGGKLYFTCPWDFDLALGNDERLDNGNVEGLYVGSKTNLYQEHEWFYLLMNNEWFCNMVRDRWNEVKKTLYDAVMPEFDRFITCFGDEMAANFDLWKIFGQKINQEPRAIRQLKSYEAHVMYLKTWFENRYTYLDGLINSVDWFDQGGFENTGGWWPRPYN